VAKTGLPPWWKGFLFLIVFSFFSGVFAPNPIAGCYVGWQHHAGKFLAG
jgi:hypothetical protein